MRNLIYILVFICISANGQDYSRNFVMTPNQMETNNTRFGSFDGENAGQKYYSVNNGFYNYGERAWDLLNQVEAAMFANGSMPGAWDYGYSGTGEINLCTGDNSMEPNPDNQSTQGSLEPVAFDTAAKVAAIWEGRPENATINGRTKTKDQWSQELANFVFDELVTRSADDKLDWSNGTATYRSNATYGTNVRYRLDGFNGSYIDCWPIFQINTQGRRYINALSLIRSQINDDAVITEASEAGGGTKLQQVEEWIRDWADWTLVHSDYKMDVFIGSAWQTQSVGAPPVNTQYSASNNNTQNHVWYDVNGNGFLEVNTTQTVTLNNRQWAGIGLLGSAGLYFNDQTYKDHAEDCFELFFKLHIFPGNEFVENYRAYYEESDGNDNCADCGMNYWIVTMWEVVDFAYQHAVAVINGVNGAGSNVGLYFDWTTSDGDQQVFSTPFVTTTTSGGTKGIFNVLTEFNKYYLTPANGGYFGQRYTEQNGSGQNALLDFNNWRFGQINARGNAYYQNATLELSAQMDTGAGFPGQGFYLDGNGTVAIPNWWYTYAGPFGAWEQHIWYGDQTDIFAAGQGGGSNPVPVSASSNIVPYLIMN